MVDLCFLGTLGNIPLPNRHLAALMVAYNGRKILIDCGEGTQVAIREGGLGFKNIDCICITHVHGDHIIGLPGLLSTMGNSDRREKVKIIGPVGLRKVVDGLNVINPYLPYELEIIEVKTEKIVLSDEIIISSLELEHSTNCVGYSFYFKRRRKFDREKAEENNVPKILWSKLQKNEEEIEYEGSIYTKEMVLGHESRGIKLSYITDTRPIKEIPEFIKDSDLFICEGNYGDDNDLDKALKNKHMTFRESATLAKLGECMELKITHFSPSLPNPQDFIHNAKEVFENSSIAYDGELKTINYRE